MTEARTKSPTVPAVLAAPLRFFPTRLARWPTERMLNHMFAAELADGDLEFLRDRVVAVCIEDIDVCFGVTLLGDSLHVRHETRDGDLRIAGTVYAFLQLVTRAEDTDTLFFRRHLTTTGDTELGLRVKNLLDSMDLDTMPLQPVLGMAMQAALNTADRIESVRKRL